MGRPVPMSMLLIASLAACASASSQWAAHAQAREDAVRRAAAAAGEDPLAGMVDAEFRAVIERVCADADVGGARVGVLDEATMCKRRGRRIAEGLAPFKARGKLRPSDAAQVKAMFAKDHPHPNSGIWVRVEDGEVVASETLGKHLFMHTASHYGLLAMLHRTGALQPGATFEYIALFGDGCGWDPTLFTDSSGASTITALPVISYSKSKRRCPGRVAMLQQPWLQQYTPPPPMAWGALNETAIFRGTLSARERLHLSVISAYGLLPEGLVDFTLALQRGKQPDHIALNAEYRRRCETWLQDILAVTGYPKNRTNPCVPGETPDGPQLFQEQGAGFQLDRKYIVSADGYAGVARFSEYFAAPGVVLSLPTSWEQFYTQDVAPWVHYVPLPGGEVDLADGIASALGYLRSHDAAARDISAAATAFHAKHLTSRAHARQWQLFFALYATLWSDDPPTGAAPVYRKPNVTCATVRASPSFVPNRFSEFIYEQACIVPIRALAVRVVDADVDAAAAPLLMEGTAAAAAAAVTAALVLFLYARRRGVAPLIAPPTARSE